MFMSFLFREINLKKLSRCHFAATFGVADALLT
jgi:hypothetical protein